MKNSHNKRRFFQKRDLLVVAGIIVLAVAGIFVRNALSAGGGVPEAVIYYNSKVVKTVVLRPSLNEKFAVPGQPNVVLEVSGGKIRFYTSTCRDKICIKAGYLSRPGQSAACLPNKVAVKIVDTGGAASSGPDTYVGGAAT